MLDRAEDPAEIIDYGYEPQLESLQRVKTGIAEVVTAKKRLQIQEVQLEQAVVKLDTQAWQTMAAGDEELARAALGYKNVAQPELQFLDSRSPPGVSAAEADRLRAEAAREGRGLPDQE